MTDLGSIDETSVELFQQQNADSQITDNQHLLFYDLGLKWAFAEVSIHYIE